jgi:apolipoprotein N-acyltransferase
VDSAPVSSIAAQGSASRRWAWLGIGLGGGLLHGLAMPGAGFFLSEWLVFVGIAIFAEICLRAARPLLAAWIFGMAHFAWSSASLRHALLPGYLAMLPAGGVYFLLMALLLRRLRARSERLALAALPLIWALYEFARAGMPEVPYPHAQSAHALYEWPRLLRPVQLLDEFGMNLLVAGIGAGLWALLRYAPRRALPHLALPLLIWGLGALLWQQPRPVGEPVTVGLMQTARPTFADQEGGDVVFDPRMYSPQVDLRQRQQLEIAALRWLYLRHLELGSELQRRGGADLLLWPESISTLDVSEAHRERDLLYIKGMLPEAELHVFGAFGRRKGKGDAEPRARISAWFVDGQGRMIGRHEKRLLVPGGERIPILATLLPRELFTGLRDWVAAQLGGRAPDLAPGEISDVLELGGAKFAARICFENAFSSSFAEGVLEQGANAFLVVSHEGWYRGGSELEQLLACSVFRALETGTPLLRATTDGVTAWIDAAGRIRERLPKGEKGVLRVTVRGSEGSHTAARARAILPGLALFAVLAMLLLGRPRRRRPAKAGDAAGLDS